MCIFVCCFIFFFKQKTAYEMRISDWSSDVCSSDLLGDFGAAHLRFLAAVDGGEIEPFVRLDEIDALAAGAGRIEDAEIETGVAVSARRVAQPALDQKLCGLQAVGHDQTPQDYPLLGNLAGWFQQMRSEEHTSELQSLMRSSYAVF